jgi:WD40 repeat protein
LEAVGGLPDARLLWLTWCEQLLLGNGVGPLATGSGDKGELNLYDAATFKWIRTLAKDADTLWYASPAFSPDGAIVAASFGGQVTLWDTQTGEELITLPVGAPAGEAFSLDGRLLASFTQKGEVQLWRTEEDR